MKLLDHARRPVGGFGRAFARGMNMGHAPLTRWGLGQLRIAPDAEILDVGCGGGATIARLLTMCPQARVAGVDYSPASVQVARRHNRRHMGTRCSVREGNVMNLPHEDASFDLVTAVETTYFWPDLVAGLAQCLRVLRPSGQCAVIATAWDPSNTTWTDRLEGMRIYSTEDMARAMKEAGFDTVRAETSPRGWATAIGTKRPDAAIENTNKGD